MKMKPSKKTAAKRVVKKRPAKRAVRRGSIEHKLMLLHNRIDEKQTSHTDSTDKQWVWTLVERVQNNEHLTKAVLLKANNLWRTYA